MSYYRTCPHCGDHLDPGEVCDCRRALERKDGKRAPNGHERPDCTRASKKK